MSEPVWNAALGAYDDGLGHIWRNATEGWVSSPGGSVAPSPSPSATAPPPMGYAGTGSDILTSAAQRDYWAGILLNQQQQNANTATANTNQYNLGLAGLQQSAQAMQNAYNTAKAQFDLEGLKARQQYELDVQRLGIDAARAAYEQRLGDANIKLQQAAFGLQGAQFELQQNQFNSQQRKDLADRKYQITKDLADRRGPENIVGYMRLLNGQGQGDPNVTTVDPFNGLADLYQESHIATPQAPNIGSLAQPVNVQAPAPFAMPQFPAYQPTTGTLPQFVAPSGNLGAPTNTSQANPAPTGSMTVRSGTNLAQYPSTPGGNPAMYGTNLNGSGAATIATGPGGNPANTAAAQQGMQIMPDGTVRRLADGGSVGVGGMAIVGDSKSGKKTGNEELVHLTLDESGRPEMTVYPHEEIAHLLDERSGRSGGSVLNSKALPEALMAMIPRAASGGVFGMGSGLGDPRAGATTGTGAAGGYGTPEVMQAPKPIGMGTQPLPREQPQTGGFLPSAPPIGMGTAPLPVENMQRETGMPPTSYSPMTSNPIPQENGGELLGHGATAMAATPTATNTIPFAPPPVAQPTAAPTPTANPNAPGTYGSDLNDQVYRFYDYGKEIGNQPFLQKLWGNQPGRPYGGFGAALSNPKLGIYNAPTALNLKNYMDLSGTEKTGTRNIYEQGLATNFDDFLEQSMRAAPLGETLAGSRYGG